MPLPSDLPAVFDIGVDHRVLLFTLAVSVLSTLLFGLAPALRVTRPDLVPALKAADADSGGKRRLWGRNTIVAGQVALSLVLLAVSAALVQGFRDELTQGPASAPIICSSPASTRNWSTTPKTRRGDFMTICCGRTRSAPGVRSAALVSTVPMAGVGDHRHRSWRASSCPAAKRRSRNLALT